MNKTIKAGIYFVTALFLYLIGSHIIFIGFLFLLPIILLLFFGVRNLYQELQTRKIMPLRYSWYIVSFCYFLIIIGGAFLFAVNKPLFTVVYSCLPSAGLEGWGGGKSCVRMAATDARAPYLCKFILSDDYQREWCDASVRDAELYDLALSTRDIEKCKMISDRSIHYESDICVSRVAQLVKAPEDCFFAKGQMNHCLRSLFESDPTSYNKERISLICSKASNSGDRQLCYSAAAGGLKDKTYCSVFNTEEENRQCLSWAGWGN